MKQQYYYIPKDINGKEGVKENLVVDADGVCSIWRDGSDNVVIWKPPQLKQHIKDKRWGWIKID